MDTFTTELKFANQNDDLLIQVINYVIDKLEKKFIFSYYMGDDIRQEAWGMAMEALGGGKYKKDRPIEKFLYTHIKNRLINLRRDRMRCGSLMNTAETLNEPPDNYCPDTEYNEILSLTDKRIPAYLRSDYLRLLDGVKIPIHRKDKIRSIMEDLLK